MLTYEPRYFSACIFPRVAFLLLICILLLTCHQRNNSKQTLSAEAKIEIFTSAININTASAAELEKLPHIGEQTAREIISHREKFGRFRRTEHLLLVRGISDERFRAMRNLIRAE